VQTQVRCRDLYRSHAETVEYLARSSRETFKDPGELPGWKSENGNLELELEAQEPTTYLGND